MSSGETSSNLLGESTLGYLRRRGLEELFVEGEAIVHRGDRGTDLFVVLDGEVEVRLEDEKGKHLPLCRMGPGATFGEMSILRDAPASADVVALGDTRVLRYPADALPTALAECEALRQKMMRRLAHNLHRTTKDAWGLFRKAEALTSLVRGEAEAETIVAVSSRMRAVARRTSELADTREPVLVTGESGTGKLHVVRRIHEDSTRSEGPLIVVDCLKLVPVEARTILFGPADAELDPNELETQGALHLANSGTLVLRNLQALRVDLQLELVRFLQRWSDGEVRVYPDARIMATVRETDGREQQGMIARLRSRFTEQIRIPRLVDRRRDIVPLAQRFLEEFGGDRGLSLDPSAERALVSLHYRYHNVSELRDVVELAAHVVDGTEVRAEHVFGGMTGRDEPIGHDLSVLGFVRGLTRFGRIEPLRMVVLLSFAAVIGACLIAPMSAVAAVGNGFIWWGWEPAVFALFLLVGPVWCTVCPLSSAGRLAQRLVALSRPPPHWIKVSGVWISTLGFFLILWVEQVFHMTGRAFPTGVMLLTLIAAAVTFSVIYQREVWCRHLCPLGRLGVALAPAAPVTVAADRRVCSSTCTTHECYRGTVLVPGCTVFHHPQLAHQAHHCKQCLDCLRTCPHGSASLFLRPPLAGAWQLGGADTYVVPFALSVLLLSPVFLAAQAPGPLSMPVTLTVAGFVMLGLTALLSRWLPAIVHGSPRRDSSLVARVACALMVLGWGPLMAIQANNVPVLADLRLEASGGASWAWFMPDGLSVLVVVRAGLVLAAAMLAALVLWRVRVRAVESEVPLSTHGWWALRLACVGYLVVCLWLSATVGVL